MRKSLVIQTQVASDPDTNRARTRWRGLLNHEQIWIQEMCLRRSRHRVIVTVARSLGGITYRHRTEAMTAHLARSATADDEACNKHRSPIQPLPPMSPTTQRRQHSPNRRRKSMLLAGA
jgi:hypothetical protein